MSKTARRDDGVGALPDDLLLDVLARVADSSDLLRCAGVCRRWLRLIADPTFLRCAGVLPEDTPDTSFLAGAFYQDARLFSSEEGSRYKQGSQFLPKFKRLYPWPGADWPLRFSFPNRDGRVDYFTWPFNGATWSLDAGWPLRLFVPNPDGLFNWALPLVSRRGLLLLRVLPTPLDWRELHLVVCDPLIGSHRRVPPLTLVTDPKLCGRDVTGYAILTDAHRRRTWGVLITAVNSDDGLLYAYSYSSATDSWSAAIKCSQVSGLTMSGPRAGVVARGIVYWLYRDEANFYAVGVSADATEVSLTKIPTQVDHDPLRLQPPFPCIVAGKLSFATVDRRTSGRIDLWTKHDDDDDPGSEGRLTTHWTRSYIMSSKKAQGITIFAFAESRGAILIHDGDNLFTLDLENKTQELVKCSTPWDEKQLCRRDCYSWCDGYNSCQLCRYNSHVLYEMDWPSYILNLSSGMLHNKVKQMQISPMYY